MMAMISAVFFLRLAMNEEPSIFNWSFAQISLTHRQDKEIRSRRLFIVIVLGLQEAFPATPAAKRTLTGFSVVWRDKTLSDMQISKHLSPKTTANTPTTRMFIVLRCVHRITGSNFLLPLSFFGLNKLDVDKYANRRHRGMIKGLTYSVKLCRCF